MRTLVAVTLLVLFAAVAGCGKKTDAPGGAGAATDKERLQGVWAVEAIEFGDPNRKPRGDEKAGRLQFKGDRLVVTIDGWHEYALALDETKEPRAMLLTSLDRATGQPYRHMTKRVGAPDEVGPMQKEEWIYKIDGNELVIALVRGGRGERPKEFKASEEPLDVLVLRLKKTDEAVPPPRPKATQPSARPAPPAGEEKTKSAPPMPVGAMKAGGPKGGKE